MSKLLLASNNRGKLRELQEILSGSGVEVLTPQAIGGIPEVEESGSTFAENAILKATQVAAATGLSVCADDSGLEVVALGGEPGVRSARYAGPGASDADRCAKLLNRLAGVSDRRARFVCVIAVATPAGLVGTAEGEVRGRLIDAPRGHNGFGYDPLFVPDGHTETFAELDGPAKERISHRGNALRAALARGLLASGGPTEAVNRR